MELGILALVQYNVHHRDSKAILGAFGKSLTPQHLNQHQRKTKDEISKVSYKLTFISILMIFDKKVHRLFGGCSKETVRYVLERYRLDFLMCGYKRTLDQLKQLL